MKLLPKIFEHIGATLTEFHEGTRSNLEGDLPYDKFMEKITRMLRVWGDWAIYNDNFLLGLEAIISIRKNHFSDDQYPMPPQKNETNECNSSSHTQSMATTVQDQLQAKPIDGKPTGTHITNYVQDNCDHPDKILLIDFENWFNEMRLPELEERAKDHALNLDLSREMLIERLLKVEEMRIIREHEDIINKLKNLDIKGLTSEVIGRIYGMLDGENFPGDLIKKFGANQPEIDEIMTNLLRVLKLLQQNSDSLAKKNEKPNLDGEELSDNDYPLFDIPRCLAVDDIDGIDGVEFESGVDADFIDICEKEEELLKNQYSATENRFSSFHSSQMMLSQFIGGYEYELKLRANAIYPDQEIR
jgi:hypothetical protein